LVRPAVGVELGGTGLRHEGDLRRDVLDFRLDFAFGHASVPWCFAKSGSAARLAGRHAP
jgi:hypothetical protein